MKASGLFKTANLDGLAIFFFLLGSKSGEESAYFAEARKWIEAVGKHSKAICNMTKN